MTILGIETSCDETSLALVRDGKEVIHEFTHSQYDTHRLFAGVVPEFASREHVKNIGILYKELVGEKTYDAIAVTQGPGLSGSLVVGNVFAKTLSLLQDVPIVGVHHVLAHMYAIQLSMDIEYPFGIILLSGGHSVVTLCTGPLECAVLGTSIDDSCGECFDKIAQYLGLDFPGGALLEKHAKRGNAEAFSFPIPLVQGKDFSFSFSGIKTAVVHQRKKFQQISECTSEDIAASFQAAVGKALKGIVDRIVERYGSIPIVFCGGVAANQYLREVLMERVSVPMPQYCTDNAAMIAGLGYHYVKSERFMRWDAPIFTRDETFKRFV